MTARPADHTSVLSVASSIAEGVPVDWEHLPADADGTTTAVLDELRVLERVSRMGQPVPNNWGSFAILGEIGHGAYGTVYRALDATLNLEVALKVIRPRGPLRPRDPDSGVERSAAAGPGEPSERRAGLQGRATGPGRGRGDGAAPRPHLRGTGPTARAVQRPRGHARRRGHLLRACRGARGTIGPRRRQGPERHARDRRPHGADGLRRRLRREDRRHGGPPLRRDRPVPGAPRCSQAALAPRSRTSTASASCSSISPPAISPSKAAPAPRCDASTSRAAPAGCCATCAPTCPTTSSTWSNGPRPSVPASAIRPPASSKRRSTRPCGMSTRCRTRSPNRS